MFEWNDAVDARAERRRRHVAVLKAWAADTDGPRTMTAYEAWRRSSDRRPPSRNTITRAFGTWTQALDAAGIGTEGCRPADAVARMQAATAASRAVLRSQQRHAILVAARECAQMLGRSPRPTEYSAWRRDFAPEAPSHMTIYRIFPDGWASVLQALVAEAGSPPGAEALEPSAQLLHIPTPAREDLAREPDVQAGSVDQVGHEGVAGHEVAAWQRQ